MNANKRRGTAFERRAQSGAKDRGDIAGVRLNGHRIVVECKAQSVDDLVTLLSGGVQ